MSQKPVKGGDPAGGVEKLGRGRRQGGGEVGGRPGQPSLPPPVLLGVVEMWAAELRGWGCADSLNAALAHSPLRNCPRRGFPRGGHSIQPLHTPRAAATAPPPPHKMAAPIEETAAASSAPFCGRREICQHGIPRLRMHPSLEILLKGWSRGDPIQRKMSATSVTFMLFFFFFTIFIFSKEAPEAAGVIVTKGRRESFGRLLGGLAAASW